MFPATQSPHLRYGFALLAVLLTLLLKLLLSPWIALENSFLLFTAAVVVSAWYGGLEAGFFATTLAAIVSNYFFLSPGNSFLNHSLGQNLSLGLFLLEGGLISWLIGYLQKRRENELLVALSGFQIAARAVNCVIYEWDTKQNIVKRTQGLVEVLGYSPLEAEETNAWWLEQIHPDERENARNQVWEALVNPNISSFDIEYRIKHKNNYYLYVADRGMIVRNADGEAIRVTGCTLDFSERKQVEISLQTAKEQLEIKVEERTFELQNINEQLRQEIAERRESEQRYQTLAEVSPVGILRTNPEGEYLYVNERWCEISGLTPSQAMGSGWLLGLHPEDRERVRQVWYQTAQANLPFRLEYRFESPDGITTWVFGQSVAQVGTTGEITGYVGSITDITQRKQAEMALQESVSEAAESLGLLRMVVTNTPTILYAVDSEGLFTLSEGKGLESLGLKPGELVGQSVFEVYRDNPNIIEYTRRILAGEEATWSVEIENKWFENRSALLRNKDGKIFGLMGISTEITERKRAEEALQEGEQRFRQITENIHEVFYLSDLKQLKIIYVSPAYEEIWGRSCQSLYENSQSFLETIHPEDREHANACFHQKYEGEEVKLEYRIIRPDGTIRWIWDRCFLVRNEFGEVYRICGVAEDITERKLSEAAILRANEELEFRVQVRTAELRRSEKRFRTSVENMLDCLGICTAIRDESGRILDFRVEYVNSAACASNLLTSREQIGRRLCELFPSHQESGLFDEYVQVVETRQPLIKESIFSEDVFGDQRLKRVYDIRVAPLGDGFVATWRDISERKQAEEELYRREQEFKALVENSPDIVSRVDTQLRHLYVCPAVERAIGIPPQDFIGKTYSEMGFPEEKSAAWETALLQVLALGQEGIIEFDLAFPDGTTKYYESRLVPEFAQDGSTQSVLTVTRDITELKEIEKALRESEGILRAIVDNSEVLIYLKDLEGRYILVNRQWELVTKLSAQQIIGKTDYDLLPQEVAEIFRSNDQRVIETRTPLQFEEVLLQEDGPHTYIALKFLLYNLAREPYAVGGISTDITQRKQAEEELHRREQTFKALAENSPDIIARFDWQMRHLYVNPAVLRATGLSPEAIIGKTNLELGMLEEKSNYWNANLQQVFTTGQERIIETDFPAADGTTRYYQSRLVPEFASDGSIESVLSVAHDITDRRQIEEALKESEAKFRRLFESNIIGVIFANISGEITDANDAFLSMIGYTRQDLQQGELHWPEITPPEYLPIEEQAIAQIQTTRSCAPYEKEYIRKDGTRLPILLGSAMLEGSDDNCVCFVIDLTEQKRAQEERAQALIREQEARKQAEAASRTKDEFLAIVSHELRSPLNAILGWARLLRSRKLDEAKTNKALETIERNAQAQTQLIEDLLDISRIIRGQVRLYSRPINLIPVIEAAIDTVRPTADTKMIQLESRLEVLACMVFGDADRLQQVVWNLLSNAVKFTPSGGHVEVRVQRVNSRAQIQVIDTGKGISPDFLPYVFERFRQAESTTTRTSGGLGLGLAIVRNLVELHGGTIKVESQGEEQGSTFTLQLPLLSNPGEFLEVAEHTGESSADAGNSSSLNGLRVLIVDDELDTREFLVTALEQFGAQVTAVESAQEAMQKLQQWKPDVLVSDIGMPIEDGYSLIRQIRALSPSQGGQIPAAALTAYAREEDRILALRAGFQLHVAKPIEPIQLLKVVADLAGRVGNG